MTHRRVYWQTHSRSMMDRQGSFFGDRDRLGVGVSFFVRRWRSHHLGFRRMARGQRLPRLLRWRLRYPLILSLLLHPHRTELSYGDDHHAACDDGGADHGSARLVTGLVQRHRPGLAQQLRHPDRFLLS